MSAIDIPKPPGSSVASDSVHESRSRHSRRGGPPSVIDTSVHVDTPPVPATTEEDHPPPSVNVDTSDDPVITVPTFRGQPVDTRPTGGHGPPMAADRFQSPPDAVPPRPLFNSAATNRTGTLTRTPTRMHPFSAEVTFGAESFEDYMCQFMCGECSQLLAKSLASVVPNHSVCTSVGFKTSWCASVKPLARTPNQRLDLSVRNLTSEWRPEIRRLVERDKRTGHDGALPFKLSLAQLATTFVEYASEIGRDPPSSQQSSTEGRRRPSSDALKPRRLTSRRPCPKRPSTTRDQPDGLAQRNPQLKAQIANSHKQFRSRLNSANTRGRPPPPTNRTMRRILEHEPAGVEVPATEDKDDDEDEDELVGFQQNSLRVTAAEEVDFEACFDVPSTNSITIPVADANPALPASETIHIDDVLPEPILLRRLAETYDRERQLSFAHADNGSMACTANDRKLLLPTALSVAPTSASLTPVTMRINLSVSASCACRLIIVEMPEAIVRIHSDILHSTIPGIIISHAAISKQLGTDGYHMSSFSENIGHIHFPHRLRRSQDIHIILQPTASRGGLTFTEALIAPTAEAHLAPLPSDQVVRKLCTEHAPVTAATILDPIDGMTCDACHSPPAPNSNVLPASPDGNARPYVFGQGMAPAGLDFIVPVNIDTDRLSHEGHRSEDLLAQRPTILDGDVHFRNSLRLYARMHMPCAPESYGSANVVAPTAWAHQFSSSVGDASFCKRDAAIQIPTELEGCPICLAAKLRKAPKESKPQ
ncbi:hypothetical protein MHU86_23588 [Fragilaria crotonensis]|nr:hypothetical protein MHU86_23588 [Fragilaria crotonensis]